LIRKVGLRRIEREIDIVRYIRNQITLTTIIKAMTSKSERTAVRNSFRFMVGNESEVNTTSESESDAFNETLLNQSWNIRGHSLQIELRKKSFV
jgi:hypothetical protein